MLLAGTCTTSVYKQCKIPVFFKKSAWQYLSVPGILDSQDSPFIDMCCAPSHLKGVVNRGVSRKSEAEGLLAAANLRGPNL